MDEQKKMTSKDPFHIKAWDLKILFHVILVNLPHCGYLVFVPYDTRWLVRPKKSPKKRHR